MVKENRDAWTLPRVPALVNPGTGEAACAATPVSEKKLRREAPSGTIDPVTVPSGRITPA